MNIKKEIILFRIFRDIKRIKIQGATNIAKAAIYAYSLFPDKSTLKRLVSLRPTEPMLQNVVKMLEKGKKKEDIMSHFSDSQEKINKQVFKIINNKDVILTHCHSTAVVRALIYSKQHGKKFQVYNTETRPLYQGKQTAKELSHVGIKVTTFVDSAVDLALSGSQGFNKVNKVIIGSDAILRNGDVINKVGSNMIADLAKFHRIKLYVVGDSWKFTRKNILLEQRSYKEVWDNKVPRSIKIKNPSFEKVPSKNISFIISELGILTPKEFVKKLKN
ncbi:MAG TPA: translation initiation factor eIF-2B [Candidatus Paceibacterota bacterium]|nr:translation initiation factor eIF-2B [Candidatus Paceibacterota bacterium]